MQIENVISRQIWEDRYKKGDETFEDNLRRVAKYTATNKKEEQDFFNVMRDRLFFPAGRTMSNSGIGENLTLNNCFVANSVQDNIDGIFDRVKLGAKTHQRGGGIGYDFSLIRPSGTPTSNDAIASGVVSFMNVFDSQTATILQGGRRGANMGVLSIRHPDIYEYINAKSYEEGKLVHFNLSIMVDDEFMNTVENDENFTLHYPVYDEKGYFIKDKTKWTHSKEIKAREMWDIIMKRAYDNGEPGILFYDNMNKDNNTSYIETIIATNPCGEYLSGLLHGRSPKTNKDIVSDDYMGACNLGSLFLHNFVTLPFQDHATVDWDKLKLAVDTGVRMLDNIISINNFPHENYKNYQENMRTVGLGVTGLANMLAMLGIKYGSKMSVSFTDELMNFISKNAYIASIELAKEKGSFPFLDKEKFIKSNYIQKHIGQDEEWKSVANNIKKYGIRNARIMSIAPTGTISLTYGENCSSGIEPTFSLSYQRKVKIGGQDESNIQIVDMNDYAYGLWKQTSNNTVPEEVFVTAMDLSVDKHVDILATVAFHTDMSVSKTINIPTDYSFEDTKQVYVNCWKKGIKGCTIFRPNEIRQGILINNDSKEAIAEETTDDEIELPWGTTISCSDDLIGKKRKIVSGCGNIHVQAWFDPIDGRCMEIFLSKGSSGGCNSFMISLSRMTSLALRTGASFDAVVDQLKSIPTCASYAVRTSTKKDTSRGNCCPTALSNAMVEMQNEIYDDLELNESDISTSYNIVATQPKITTSEEIKKEIPPTRINPCPKCGEEMVNEGGCIQCKDCGWSKCD